jgi:hypothetical protein
VLQDPSSLFEASPEERLFLLPEGLSAVEIFTIEGSRPGLERVNDRTSPVVEVEPARVTDGVMRAGRLYLGVSPSDGLYGDAKRLFEQLKRKTDSWHRTKEDDVRVGPRTAEAAAKAGLRIASAVGARQTLARSLRVRKGA